VGGVAVGKFATMSDARKSSASQSDPRSHRSEISVGAGQQMSLAGLPSVRGRCAGGGGRVLPEGGRGCPIWHPCTSALAASFGCTQTADKWGAPSTKSADIVIAAFLQATGINFDKGCLTITVSFRVYKLKILFWITVVLSRGKHFFFFN